MKRISFKGKIIESGRIGIPQELRCKLGVNLHDEVQVTIEKVEA